jgi:HK97 family phage major capsid protein
MSTVKELREKQARIATNARAKFDEIKDDTPAERAAEIEREFDAMMAEYDAIEAKIERAKRLEEAEARMNQGDPRRPNGGGGEVRGDGGDDRPTYKDAFVKAIRFGAAALSAEERAVLREGRADLPPEVRAQATGTDAAGGYTVPQEFSGEIDRALLMWGPMWDGSIVREINTTNGREIDWPTVDDTGKSGRIKAENAAVDDDGTDDVTFGEKKLNAYIFDTGMVRIPIELLEDSAFAIEPLMTDLFGERLGRLANLELTTGSGSSRPQGIVPAAAVGVTAAGTAAITSDELIDLQHSVDPAYRMSPRCRWMFNDSTLATIRKLKDGDGNYLWQMGDVRAGEPSTLLGKPYSVNQAMANIGAAAKPILFGDLSRYVVRKVMGFQVMTLRERYAENFQIGMVGFKRFDGELLRQAAVKVLQNAAA